eukprot:SAG31_NODE_922_length_10976_cov_8.838742_1_plen_175_part_10
MSSYVQLTRVAAVSLASSEHSATECGGAVGTTVQLAAGPAQITITPVPPDDSYCCWADRNIDVIMLHPNASDVERRVNGTADPADGQVLPLDGLFSQHGEVFFKIQNKNTTHNLSVAIPLTYDHAPYMGQHDYLNKSSSYITVAPGKTTGWIEVGGLVRSYFLVFVPTIREIRDF